MTKLHYGVCALLTILLTGCISEEKQFISLCETAIQDTLRSPSGYKLIKSKFSKDQISASEYYRLEYTSKGKKLSSTQQETLDSGLLTPIEFKATVEYDAPNAYGTLVREHAACTYRSAKQELGDVSWHSVAVNGRTSIDRLTDFANQVSNDSPPKAKRH